MSKPKGYGEAALRQLKRVCWEHRIKVVWSKPLAKGTYQTLRELLPAEAISNKKLYSALCCHTRSPGYLQLLRTNAVRLAPGGEKADRVTLEESQFAVERLKASKRGKRRYSPKPKGKAQNSNRPHKPAPATAKAGVQVRVKARKVIHRD